MCVCMCVWMCVCVCMCAYVCVCMYVYVCVCAYMYGYGYGLSACIASHMRYSQHELLLDPSPDIFPSTPVLGDDVLD